MNNQKRKGFNACSLKEKAHAIIANSNMESLRYHYVKAFGNFSEVQGLKVLQKTMKPKGL